VGNAQEFGSDRKNVVFCDRSLASFAEGLRYAREHRSELSAAIVDTLRGWAYGEPGQRAQWYFALFRKLIAKTPPKPFSYHETHWSAI
jgi:hypothetical protein